MANPGGVNQLGGSHVPYGDVKRAKQLAGEAPMSGAPIATSALAAPQRARRNNRAAAAAPQPTQQPIQAAPPEMPQIPTSELYQSIAQIPGASDTVKAVFGGAQ